MPISCKNKLSHDVTSGSEIRPCIKIDKPLVVLQIFGKRYDVHNNIAYIMTKLYVFTSEMRFQSNLNVI